MNEWIRRADGKAIKLGIEPGAEPIRYSQYTVTYVRPYAVYNVCDRARGSHFFHIVRYLETHVTSTQHTQRENANAFPKYTQTHSSQATQHTP